MHAPRCTKNLRRRERGVGLLEQQVAGCPSRDRCVQNRLLAGFERLRQHAALEQRLFGLLGAGRAGQHVQPVFDARSRSAPRSSMADAADQRGDADKRGDVNDQSDSWIDHD